MDCADKRSATALLNSLRCYAIKYVSEKRRAPKDFGVLAAVQNRLAFEPASISIPTRRRHHRQSLNAKLTGQPQEYPGSPGRRVRRVACHQLALRLPEELDCSSQTLPQPQVLELVQR